MFVASNVHICCRACLNYESMLICIITKQQKGCILVNKKKYYYLKMILIIIKLTDQYIF